MILDEAKGDPLVDATTSPSGERRSSLLHRASVLSGRLTMKIAKGATFAVALILALSASALATDTVLFAAPFPDKQCMGSPSRLGTDNIPPGRGKRSTIVDISAISKTPTSPALAWVYTTHDDRLWVQANVATRNDLLHQLDGTPFLALIQNAAVIRDGTPPVAMSQHQVQQFETTLKKRGFARQQCFSQRLPAKYTKY